MRCLILVICGVLAGACFAGENGKKAKRSGPLAKLPSKPGPHIAKIKALGDNAWLNLGAPKPDPKWGKARGRSWTFKMPYAPELRGAFLYGTGVHGFVKPDGHFQDDLFFYDINAHKWICCYPGLGLKPEHPDLKVDKNGWERDASGQPIPVINGHAWGHVTYDPHRKMFVHARHGGGSYRSLWAKRKNWYSKEKVAKPGTPWAWNIMTGRWESKVMEGRRPGCSNGSTFTYVSSSKQFLLMNRETFRGGRGKFSAGRVRVYDPATGKWSTLATKLPRPNTLYDGTSCYDPKRDRIYIGGGANRAKLKKTLWIFDVKTNTWSQPKGSGSPIRSYATNCATMRYDVVNDVVVVCAYADHPKQGYKPEELGVYVFDPAKNDWLSKVCPLPKGFGPRRNAKVASFYDPELNAHFFHAANDSRDNGIMWVWRYKRRKAKK